MVAWLGVIFFLSSQPRLPQVVPSFFDSFQDILGHFVAYAVLAVLLLWALTGLGARHAAWLTLLIALLYALSDEFHQSFVPGRHPDPFDVATDLAGAGAALIILNFLRFRRRRHLPR